MRPSRNSSDALALTRRQLFSKGSAGIGVAALASLLRAEPNGLPHFAPRAKRIIWLYMSGGPSHLETFDYKPRLAALDGQPMPESFTRGQPIAQLQGQKLACLGPQLKFRKWGRSGQEISTLFPHIGSWLGMSV